MHPTICRANRDARITPTLAPERRSRPPASRCDAPRVVRSFFHLSHAGSRKRDAGTARA